MLWLHFFRPRPQWYGLSAAAQDELAASWRAAGDRAAAGGRAELLGEYTVRGQSIHERVQVWTFATATGIEDFWTDLLEAGYADWRESENVVGAPEIPVAYVAASDG